MTSSPPLACPACQCSLREAHPTLGVFACDACGGIWTDHAATEALRTSADGSITSVSKEAAAHAPTSAPAGPRRRRCPDCRHHLQRTTLRGVEIDTCGTHGTWFDRGEIEAIYAATEKPGGSSFGAIAMGVLEVFGAILSAAG